MGLIHQIQKPRKAKKQAVSAQPHTLEPGEPCPLCGHPVKWDRKEYQRQLMKKRRAADKAAKEAGSI